MRLTHLAVRGLKSIDRAKIEIPPLLAIGGPNGAGKTTLLQAIRLGILGHEPSLGRTLASTRLLSRDGYIAVTLTFDTGFGVRRSFGESQTTETFPPQGERTEKEKQARIDKETGSFVPAFDIASFLALSSEKRRGALFSLLPRESVGLTQEIFREWLGYESADAPVRRAVDKLWLETVLAVESPVDGLASALEYMRERTNEAERERLAQVKVVEAADRAVTQESAVQDCTDEDMPVLQAELSHAEEEIGRIRGLIEEGGRVTARRLAREERLSSIASDIRYLEARRDELDQLIAAPLQEGVSEAGLASAADELRELRSEHERLATACVEALMRREQAEKDIASRKARLASLDGAQKCPTCGSTASLDAFRAQLVEEIDSGQADYIRLDGLLEEARSALSYSEKKLTLEESRVSELQRVSYAVQRARTSRAQWVTERSGVVSRLGGLEQLRAQVEAEEVAEPAAIDEAKFSRLSQWASECRQRITAQHERDKARAHAAGKVAADRERVESERAELEQRTQRSESLKSIQSSLQALRAHVITGMVGPIQETADEILQTIDPGKRFRFVFEREGKDTFDFGFEQNGVFRSYDAASSGEDAFLAVVFVAALIAAVQPGWPVLMVDNIEQVDSRRREWLMTALAKLEGKLGNIILAGCCNFAEVDGWDVLDARSLAHAPELEVAHA